jgi:hypothetical protein
MHRYFDFSKKTFDTVETWFRDVAWASHQCIYIRWDIAVCMYTRFQFEPLGGTFTWLPQEYQPPAKHRDYWQWVSHPQNYICYTVDIEDPSAEHERRRAWKVVLPRLDSDVNPLTYEHLHFKYEHLNENFYESTTVDLHDLLTDD